MQDEKALSLKRRQSVCGLLRLFLVKNGFRGILLASACFILWAGLDQTVQAQAPSVPEVEVATVIQKDLPIYSEWVGTTEGLVNAKIRAQVTGYLARQAYKEGSSVKKGDLLFEIDPRTFKAALDQAEAQLAIAKARLKIRFFMGSPLPLKFIVTRFIDVNQKPNIESVGQSLYSQVNGI